MPMRDSRLLGYPSSQHNRSRFPYPNWRAGLVDSNGGDSRLTIAKGMVMKARSKRQEGVLQEDSGKKDKEGFIAPVIGAMEHVLYFTTAPSVSEKTKQLLTQGRLVLPGAVVVWDETIGRRKGAKATAKSWWAGNGSLTAAFAFPSTPKVRKAQYLQRTATAVLSAIASFHPSEDVSFVPPNDLMLAGKKVGAIAFDSHAGADFVVVRLNCCPDLSKAPAEISANACKLVDFIDVKQLPLKRKSTLPNTLLTRLMVEIPKQCRP